MEGPIVPAKTGLTGVNIFKKASREFSSGFDFLYQYTLYEQSDFLISGQISLHQSFLGLAMIR